MDLLDRITDMMKSRGLNKAQLASQAGIPKTTVYGWFNSGYENMTISTLKALCSFLDCTLDYMVNGDETEARNKKKADTECKLINAYWAADSRAQQDAMNTLLSHPKNEENDQYT